jgi:hypothetical protein
MPSRELVLFLDSEQAILTTARRRLCDPPNESHPTKHLVLLRHSHVESAGVDTYQTSRFLARVRNRSRLHPRQLPMEQVGLTARVHDLCAGTSRAIPADRPGSVRRPREHRRQRIALCH